MELEPDSEVPGEESKETTALGAGTGPLYTAPEERPFIDKIPQRNFFLRLGELAMFLAAVVGAVALGLRITQYFSEHTYIGAYLLAYAGFRFADLLVRDEYSIDPSPESVARRLASHIPVLLLFAAAPFERTYIYGGEAARWAAALALLLELAALWLALGARIQLGFFSWEEKDGVRQQVLVRSGFYRFIRHPTYTGVWLALFAWPIAYLAPISAILTLVIGGLITHYAIKWEERELLARWGEDYLKYREETDAVIPNLW